MKGMREDFIYEKLKMQSYHLYVGQLDSLSLSLSLSLKKHVYV